MDRAGGTAWGKRVIPGPAPARRAAMNKRRIKKQDARVRDPVPERETEPARPEEVHRALFPSLLPFCTVVPAPVTAVAPIRPDPDTGGLALLADRAVVLHPGGL
jgi:hypothetical protein